MPSPMFRAPLVALSVTFAAAGCATAAPPHRASVETDDRAVVEAVLAEMNGACARRDLPGFMGLFEAGDRIALVGSDAGEAFRGRVAVEGFMRKLFSYPFTFAFEWPDPVVRRHGDTAWFFSDGVMAYHRSDGTVKKVPYRVTGVLVRTAAGWRWQIFSGSSPRPE